MEGIFNEGLRKVFNNQLPLYLSATSQQFFIFIGSQNRFHLLIYTSWSEQKYARQKLKYSYFDGLISSFYAKKIPRQKIIVGSTSVN